MANTDAVRVQMAGRSGGEERQPGMAMTEAEAKAFVEQIARRNRTLFDSEQGQAIFNLLHQVFQRPGQWALELLQNAIDAHATDLRFRSGPGGGVEVCHNGIPFTPEDVSGLSGVGISTKRFSSAIGFMGVGFKSVFQRFQTVEIRDPIWQFRLGYEIRSTGPWYGTCAIPRWTPADPLESGFTTRFRLRPPDGESVDWQGDLEPALSADSLTLAWLAHLGLRRLETPEGVWRLGVEPLAGEPDALWATVEGPRGTVRWVLFLHHYTPSAEAQQHWCTHRGLSFEAAPREATLGIGCRVGPAGPELPQRGRLYAGLPLDRTWPVRLHLQAPWDVELARRDVAPLSSPWHRDLLAKLPTLLARWSKWVAETARQDPAWAPALLIWPDGVDPKDEWGAWWTAASTQSAVRDAHAKVRCVPVRGAPGQLRWVRPGTARIPPHEGAPPPERRAMGPLEPALHVLWEEIDQDDYTPWALWPVPLASLGALGGTDPERQAWAGAVGVEPLSLEDLLQGWTEDAWASWAGQWSDSERWDRLLAVAAAVGLTWRDAAARLPLLPTEGGAAWKSPAEVIPLPQDWQLVSGSEWADSLRDAAGSPEWLLNWTFTQYARRRPFGTPADYGWRWIADQMERYGRTKSLEEVLEAWWTRLVAGDPAEAADRGRRLTAWVCRQHLSAPQRWVKRVLAQRDGTLIWAAPEKTYLGPPYTGSAVERALGDTVPWVDPGYLAVGGDVEEWVAFWIKLGVVARVGWEPRLREAWAHEVRSALSQPIRSTYAEPVMWTSPSGHTIAVDYGRVYGVDWDVPSGWREAVAAGDAGRAGAWAEWAAEYPEHLLGLLNEDRYRPRILYMHSRRYVVEEPVDHDPAWLRFLQTEAWVPTAEGLRAPADVLLVSDPERPDALQAELPRLWRDGLRGLPIPFGERVPRPDAVERLRRSTMHPAPAERLMAALEAAAEDENARTRLMALLSERALIPHPKDPTQGVRLTHLVRSLARWPSLAEAGLVALQDAEATPRAALYRAVAEMFSLPDEPTGDQAWDILEAIWRRDPGQAPIECLAAAWECLAVHGLPQRGTERAAAVRVLCRTADGRSQWASPPWTGALLPDRAVPRHVELTAAREALWVEAIQFGRVADAVVARLGLPRFGERYAFRVAWDGPVVSEPLYRRGLAAVLRWLHTVEPALDAGIPPAPSVEQVRHLRLRVEDRDGKVTAEVSLAAHWSREEEVLRVTGGPRDFASDVTLALATAYPALTGDLRLAAEMTTLVNAWEDPEWVERRVEGLIRQWRGGATPAAHQSTFPEDRPEHHVGETASNAVGDVANTSDAISEPSPAPASPSWPKDVWRPERPSRDPGAEGEAQPVPGEGDEARAVRRPVTVSPRTRSSYAPGLDTQAVGDAGVEAACRYERRRGRVPEVLPPNHPGWDITSRDPAGGTRYIEVKATRGPWPAEGVGLSPTQLEAAQSLGPAYFLYVVEYVGSADERLHVISDPAGRATEYRFGPEWEKETSPAAEPPLGSE